MASMQPIDSPDDVRQAPDAPPMPDVPIPLEAIRAAAERIAPHRHRTPLLRSSVLGEHVGGTVLAKAELLQRVGAYKFRGPLNKLALMDDDARGRGIVCSSAGNHAQGVALAGRIHGVRAVVVMSERATPSKIAATRGYGAEVRLHGTSWEDANAEAHRIADEEGMTFVHPFDDPELIAGQATVGLEIAEDVERLHTVVVPIGGGGLISGVASAIKQLHPGARVVGVEAVGAPSMLRSLEAGERVVLEHVDTRIDGLAVQTPGALPFAIAQRCVDEVVTVSDEEISDAVVWTMHHMKLVPEGAAAAPIAALLNHRVTVEPGAVVVPVLSGGNLDLTALKGLRWN